MRRFLEVLISLIADKTQIITDQGGGVVGTMGRVRSRYNC